VITLEFIYVLMGVLTAGVAIVSFRDRTNAKRANNAAFWALYSATFFFGTYLPPFVSGLLALSMVAVAGFGKLGKPSGESASAEERLASARRWGNRLFIPALAIPAFTLLGTFTLKKIYVNQVALIDGRQVTLIALGLATMIALVIGLAMLRPKLSTPIVEARRLMDSVGWAAVLPQMLAALGAVFAAAGIGGIVTQLAERWLPLGTPFAAVAAYAIGMALFTAVMGNAFAAFPVMTAGIGLPLIVAKFGGDVTVMCAVGMVSGFCGTLTTPMAANFNIVPAALLELPNEHDVIKVQIPTAILLLLANVGIMYVFVYR
jgi:uncharacterized membrane protein